MLLVVELRPRRDKFRFSADMRRGILPRGFAFGQMSEAGEIGIRRKMQVLRVVTFGGVLLTTRSEPLSVYFPRQQDRKVERQCRS